MKFSSTYVEHVLKENFEDARRFFFQPLMDIHRAHLLMLKKAEILTESEARILAQALDQVSPERIDRLEFDGTFEDLFFYIEHLLEAECGSATAGKLHTARSRNDIAVTLYRLRWRKSLLDVLEAVFRFRMTLLEVADRHREAFLPIHTHTQPAQPSTLAHFFLGIVEHLERDHQRLASALQTMNRCPLGACAATGTGFPILRELVSDLLAFESPTGNTHASIAGVDYLLEAVGSLMVLLTHLGKVLQELLLWCMKEFQFLQLDEAHIQGSSIMPQKRNPVALEHSRALASKALGEASAIFQTLHNTPYGDIVDVEDDLQPLVFHTFHDSCRALEVAADALASATFNTEQMYRRASQDFITATELADHLVRCEGLPFRTSHAVVSAWVKLLTENPALPPHQALAEASQSVAGRRLEYGKEELESLLSPQHFVEVRSHPGGPALGEVRRALESSRQRALQDQAWLAARKERFSSYRPRLQEALRQL